ncbi:MAG: hypothetical protein ACK5LC_03595 [Coprobacillaceae bacterium]
MLRFKLDSIDNNETSIMFKEIIQQFYDQNFRSCVVQLYTLVIFDMVQKIISNSDLTQDSQLETIKNDINNKISNNEHFSSIEKYVIDELFQKKKINVIMRDKISHLREEHNNCAHFGLYSDRLHKPTENMVIDFIEYFYKHLFSKTDRILSDLNILILDKIAIYHSQTIYSLNTDEGKKRLLKDLITLIDALLHNDNISRLHSTLFELLLIKHTEDCKKYRAVTYFVFENLMHYVFEYRLKNKIDFSCYKKLDLKCLVDDQYPELFVNPILGLLKDNYIIIDELKNKNNDIFEMIRDKILDKKERHNLLPDYWTIIFSTKELLNEYLIKESLPLKTLLNFQEDIIEINHIFEASIEGIKDIPTMGGFYATDRFINYFKRIYIKLSDEQLEQCLDLMNNNSQFYNCHMIRYFFDSLANYLDEKTSIVKSKYDKIYD